MYENNRKKIASNTRIFCTVFNRNGRDSEKLKLHGNQTNKHRDQVYLNISTLQGEVLKMMKNIRRRVIPYENGSKRTLRYVLTQTDIPKRCLKRKMPSKH